jgi:hypothetical protein
VKRVIKEQREQGQGEREKEIERKIVEVNALLPCQLYKPY